MQILKKSSCPYEVLKKIFYFVLFRNANKTELIKKKRINLGQTPILSLI